MALTKLSSMNHFLSSQDKVIKQTFCPFKAFFVSLLLLCSIGVADAQTLYNITATGNINWNNAVNGWSTTGHAGLTCACYPGDATHANYNVNIGGARTITVNNFTPANSIASVTVSDDASVSSLVIGNAAAGASQLTITAALTVNSGSTVQVGGTVASTNTLAAGSIAVNGASIFLLGNTGNANDVVTVSGDITNAGTFNSSGDGGGNFNISVGGNITNTGTMNFANATEGSTVSFNGGTAQTISGAGTFTFYNLQLLTTASANVNVNSNITINNTLTFTNAGLLVVNSSSNITLGIAATAIAGGVGATKYIQLDGSTGTNSNLIVTTNGSTSGVGSWAITYPIGTATGGYTPFTLGTTTTAPTSGSTIAVKAIYNNSNQGQLRRVFRLVVAGNASASTFATASFTCNTGTDVSSGDAIGNYTTLWYLSSSSGSWSSPVAYTAATSPFTVNAGSTQSLTAGTYYYTIGQPSAYPNTWYSYQTGVWSNWQNWTSDPSGSSLVNGLNLPPQPGDAIVILNGITITNDVSGQVASTSTINAGATLDMGATTGNTLGTVSGSGLLRMNGVNLPIGTYTSFVASTGGTIEYYNTGGAASATQLTYNNLKFSNSTASPIIFITDITANPYTLTVNGTLTISATSTGTVTWQINGNTGAPYPVTNPQIITIAGDVNVSSNGKIVAGTGHSGANTPHSLTLSGNFTNNGVVQFFDPTQAPFTSANTSTTITNAALQGNAVNVTFSGVNDNTVTCNGQTDFYRFIVNKGTGSQALLNVNSSNTANFRLFGPANLGSSGQAATDYSLNALSIINGTLELTGSISIPTLIENDTFVGATSTDNFSLPVTGELWLNGAGVTVTVTSNNNGNDDQRFNLEGILLITNGTMSLGYSKGLGSGTAGSVIVQGGTLNMSQFRPRAGSATQAFSYLQTGGTVNVGTTGYNSTPALTGIDNTGYARFSIPTTGCTFQLAGTAILNIGQPTSHTTPIVAPAVVAAGGIEIGSSSANYSVTGGTINAYIPNAGSNFTIDVKVPFWNLNTYSEGTAGGLNAQIAVDPLTVQNNFAIITGNTPTFATNNNNLTVGGNFLVNTSTTFTPGTNTITFNGSGAQTLTNNQTISALTNTTIVVNKSAGTLTLGGTTSPVLPANLNTLVLTAGTLADNGSTVTVTTSLTNNATHSGTGSITYTGSAAIGGNNGTFGNLIITASNSTIATSGNQTVTGNLQLNGTIKSVLNIGSNSLTVNGTITTTQNGGVLAANWCIQTSGFHNAGGLTRPCTVGSALTFPVGSGGLYTPNTITVNTATTPGTITVRPVNSEHPNVTKTGNSVQYYWRVTSSGFVGLGTTAGSVSHSNYIFSTATKGNSSANYVAARYDRTLNSWTQSTAPSTMTTTILPNPFDTGTGWTGAIGDKLDGEYTCGNGTGSGANNAFGAVTTYYSRASGNWADVTTVWSTTSNAGGACSCSPTACPTCPVIIGDAASNNHTITIAAGTSSGPVLLQMCGSLTLSSGSTLDCSTNTFLNLGTSTGGVVSGTGTLRIGATGVAVTNMFPAGDFTNFLGSSGGTVEWYGATKTIPATGPTPQSLSLANYYNLVLNPTAANTITMAANPALTIYNNLTSGTAVTYTGTSVTNGAETISVAGSMSINAGTFNLSNGGVVALTVNGGITNAGTFAVVAGGTTHTISTPGSIINNGTMTLSNTSFANITFTGTANVILGGSGATTLNLVKVNKGSSQTPTVTCSLSGTLSTPATALGWLTLTNGTFDFEYTGASSPITLSSSSYNIPTTTKLKVGSGTVQITNASGGTNDLFLNGALEVASTGVLYTNTTNATGSDNDIEYASSGTPTITVSGTGSLTVDGSIRRSTTTLTGALVYNQTGGTVTVGGNASNNTRGVFEIDANTGSSFTMTGTSSLIVQRTSGGLSYADLFLNPLTSNVASTSTISMGINGGAQSLSANVSPSIGNFTVVGGTGIQTVGLYSNPLIVGGNLTITSPSVLDSKSLDVSIAGNLSITGTGVYKGGVAGSLNNTTFNGTGAQAGSLSAGSSFNNMTVSNTGGGTVTLSGTAPTLNNLNILSGTLDVGALALNVNGNMTNNSTQTASGGGSITFTTTTSASHTITSSNGSFTNLKIGGATAATNNLVAVTGNMTMNGYLDFVSTTASRYFFIGSSLLTFSTTGTIANAGVSTFIKTNGVSSDLGVTKNWPVGTNSFTYSIGTRTNYTPVAINSLVVTTAGNYNVVPVDATHPTSSPTGPLILDYYWKIIRDNSIVHGATGTLIFQVPTALIGGSGGTLIGAYLDAINLIGWTAGGVISVNGSNTLLTFTNSFTGASPAAVLPAANGEFDYTFGTTTTLPNPITPVYSRFGDTAPTQTTNVGVSATGGSWANATSWTLSNTGWGAALSSAPTGRPVVILAQTINNPQARINLDILGQNAFTTQITGGVGAFLPGLLVVTTAGHSIGSISGSGTMRTTVSTLPAGTYTTFTAAGGGTIEYAAAIPMNSRSTYNNLLISSPSVTTTASNLTINGNLTINAASSLDNSVSGSKITMGIAGNFSNSGTFTAGSGTTGIDINLAGNWTNTGTYSGGTSTVTLNGTAAQTITGATTFSNLTINNTFATAPQINLSGSNEVVSSTLTMTKGNINLNTQTLTLGTSAGSPGTLSHSLASTAGWMYGGNIARYFNTPAIADGSVTGFFPIGTATDFRPFFISVPAGDMTSGGSFTLSVSSSTTTTIVSIPDPTNTVSPIVRQYQGAWTATSSGITGGTYNVIAGGTGFGTIGSLADVTLSKAASALGTYVVATNTLADPRMERTGLALTDVTTSIYVGSTNASNSPLPIELLSFTGDAKKYGVDLQWKTASETNNDYFTVSRSAAADGFIAIGSVKGSGTSNAPHSYGLTDYKPLLGKNYYQLSQTDFDGHLNSIETIIVNVLSLDPLVSIYPNPLSQNQLLNVVINGLQTNSPTEIQIVNLEGIKVNGATINTDSDGTLKTSIGLTGLSAGLYILKVENVHYKFIIE